MSERDEVRERAWREFKRKRNRGDYPSDEASFSDGWYRGERAGLLAGQREMRERAKIWLSAHPHGDSIADYIAQQLAERIDRALPIEGE